MGAGGPSLAHVPAMLEFQVCNEVLYLRDVKFCVGLCSGDLLIQCCDIQETKSHASFFFPLSFLGSLKMHYFFFFPESVHFLLSRP